MKILIQWTLLNPTDWEEIILDGSHILAWANLPRKAEPVGGEVIDNTKGWIMDLNVNGINFAGYDHYSARLNTSYGEPGIDIIVWNDDPDDYPPGTRFAQV